MIKLKEKELWQWSTGRQVVLTPSKDSEIDEVHFYNGTTENALKGVVKEEKGVKFAEIPNIFLQSSNTIVVYAVMIDSTGERTTEAVRFAVNRREKPDDYVYTETEVKRYSDLEKRIEELENSTGGTVDITVDAELNAESENPVQNKAVAKAVDNLKSETSQLKSDFTKYEEQISDIMESIGYVSGGGSGVGSTNIFDKDVTVGKSLLFYEGSTLDATFNKDNRSVWNKILSVSQGDTLYYSNSWIVIGFYDSDGVYVSQLSDANFSCVVPDGASFCRIAISTVDLDSFMLSINEELPEEYEPYEPEGDGELVLNDLSKVPEDLAKIKEKVFPNDLRVILVSDVHIHSENMMMDNYGGVTHSERMKILVDSLNAEHRKKPIDCVIFLGDFTLGTNTNDVIYFAKHFLPQLEMPYHVFAGDHEVIDNAEWNEIFGTDRQYTVNVKDFAFIFLDGYRDVTNLTESGAVALSGFDQEYCNSEITKAINAGLSPILMTHFSVYMHNADSEFKKTIRENALCAFSAHSHEVTSGDLGYGWLLHQTGNFSYPNGASYSNFGENGENRWGFRICETKDNKLVTYMIYPTQTIRISEVNDGNVKTYDYTKDDDNAYGTFAIIKDFNV